MGENGDWLYNQSIEFSFYQSRLQSGKYWGVSVNRQGWLSRHKSGLFRSKQVYVFIPPPLPPCELFLTWQSHSFGMPEVSWQIIESCISRRVLLWTLCTTSVRKSLPVLPQLQLSPAESIAPPTSAETLKLFRSRLWPDCQQPQWVRSTLGAFGHFAWIASSKLWQLAKPVAPDYESFVLQRPGYNAIL